jgi:hypothetical protein
MAAEAYRDMQDVAGFLVDTGLRIKGCLSLEWPDVRSPRRVPSLAT